MGYPLDPALANIFMPSFESRCLQDIPNNFKPVYYKCSIDDIFPWRGKFNEYLSSKNPNTNFFKEKECYHLDVNILLQKRKFATNVYRKKTWWGIYQLQKCYTWNM